MIKPGKKLDQKVLVSASKSRMLPFNFKVTKETRFSNTELASLLQKEISLLGIL